jgi:RecB family exonuclease
VSSVVHLPVVFHNERLSVSRLGRYEQCPLSFYFQYVEDRSKRPDMLVDPDREPADFGNVLHDALERTYQWVIDEEYAGGFPEGQALEFYRLAWGDSGLTGVGLYQEGREMLRQYARRVGSVDHMRVLAVEREFNLLVGPGVCRLVDASERAHWQHVPDHFVINGFMDRVDRVDADTVEVVDYKSGRLLFSREELADNLQVGVYAIVAALLYPWARTVKLSFHMLRHDLVQRTSRTEAELAAVQEYVRALGARSEVGPYKAKLNTNCGYCDHRARCETYKAAVSQKLELVAVAGSDLEALAQERERVAKIAKAAYARKETLDAVLRSALGDKESLELGGVVYRLAQYFDTDYPVSEVAAVLAEAGASLEPALRVDNKALGAILDRLEADENIPHTTRDFLRVRIASKAVKTPQNARLDARARKK